MSDKFDMPLGVYWFDEDGILHVTSKNVPYTLVALRETGDFIYDISRHKKVRMLADMSETPAFDKEVRECLINECVRLFSAVALVARSPLGNVIANMLVMLKPPSFPLRKFSAEAQAKAWLKRYKEM